MNKNGMKLTATDIEIAVANFLDPRVNLIVPNVSWAFFRHECDLLCVTKSGCLWEVEIKISKADLIRDKAKWHGHFDKRIKRLYFAIPETLQSEMHHIPERAGIIAVTDTGYCQLLRPPHASGNYKISDAEYTKIAHLGAMRLWGLKKANQTLKQQLKTNSRVHPQKLPEK